MTQDKMIGKRSAGNVMCRCCIPPSWRKTLKRGAKRRERQAWKKSLNI